MLVHGASGAVTKTNASMSSRTNLQVGNACVQIGHTIGLTVIGTAGTDEGCKLVKELGADHVFNHRQGGYEKNIMVNANCDS